MRETLRQCSPIPGITLEAYEDTLLDGKYRVKKGEPIAAIFSRSHLDPAVYGEDASEFKPERMLDKNFERLQKEFPNCWKPFGNGMRACIGRPFAWQEMLLAISLLLQNFDFYLYDSAYNLKIAETLTIKPKDFFMRAALRHGMTPMDLERNLRGETDKNNVWKRQEGSAAVAKDDPTTKPISLYYGSNSGTCEALARRLASDASAHGFKPSVVHSVDMAKGRLPRDHPVVIFAASYEGQPPDNARHFVAWLESLVGQEVDGVAYAVFGAGNSEWRQTFHRIPKLIDSGLNQHGAERLVPMGSTDVAEKDLFLSFEAWEDNILWPALEARYSVSKLDGGANQTDLTLNISTPRSATLRQNVSEAVVTAARDLTAASTSRKRHIQIKLPTGMSYEAGDYLAVLPQNPRETVSRVFRRFKLAWDAVLVINGDDSTPLPMDSPTSASDVLSSYVELSLPATRKNLLVLAEHVQSGKARSELESLATEDRFEEAITNRRLSIIDLLELYPSIELPLSTFLGMLPPMRTRQ